MVGSSSRLAAAAHAGVDGSDNLLSWPPETVFDMNSWCRASFWPVPIAAAWPQQQQRPVAGVRLPPLSPNVPVVRFWQRGAHRLCCCGFSQSLCLGVISVWMQLFVVASPGHLILNAWPLSPPQLKAHRCCSGPSSGSSYADDVPPKLLWSPDWTRLGRSSPLGSCAYMTGALV